MSASEAIARLRELRAKATAEELHKRFMACATLPSREDYGVWPEWAQDPHNWPYLRYVTNSTPAIVAAMNSLPALLECAEALEKVLAACDQGRMVERGAGGMTIDAQIRRSVINGVPAMPIEEARAALQALAEGGGE